MGPTIILDKSSLQALSKQELVLLNKYYFVNIPPILPIEILGDLKKIKGDDALNEEKVTEIANKLIQKDSAINIHYKNLVVSSLMGADYLTARRPVVGGAKKVTDKDGRIGFYIKETQEAIAIRNWQKGNFEEAEKAIAGQWRLFSKGFDLNELKKNWRHYLTLNPSCKDLNQLNNFVEALLSSPNIQSYLLRTIVEAYQVDSKLVAEVLKRWDGNKGELLKDFAPYAYYCLKVYFFFGLGIVYDLITTRSTNLIDAQYLYYLPFCNIFSSGDNFHKNVSEIFLFDDQSFIHRDELKSDLKEINERLYSLSSEQRVEWETKYGSEPPVNDNSFTYKFWRKYLPNWIPGSRHQSESTSGSEREERVEELNESIDSLQQIDTNPFDKFDDEAVDFIAIEKWISPDDQCPCGSGTKFRDCCFSKLNNA